MELIEKDSIFYLAPHRFGTRSSEVAREKPGKEITIDASSLKVHDTKHRENLSISNEYELSQAFTRRALACDLVGLVSFGEMEKWHRYLFQHLTHSPPPGFNKPSLEQLLRADRAAWIRLAEKTQTLRRDGTGSLPMDKGFEMMQVDSSVNFHLLPLPQNRTKPPKGDKTIKADSDDASPIVKKKGKGKGKGKSKVPKQLKGLNTNTPEGDRVCFNYNLAHGCSYAKGGDSCKRGKHACMKCFGSHPQHKCRKADE